MFEKKLEPMSMEKPSELRKEAKRRGKLIGKEIEEGLSRVEKYPKSVTILGSARFSEDNPYYQKARNIASSICELGYAVITGGGGGIMEAGNRGAKEKCGARSVGFNIELPNEQQINPYVTDALSFHYFFTRKVALFFSAEVYLFFPGGFGTMDEFFELITLVQTKKIPRVPIVLVGSEYWGSLDTFIRKELAGHYHTIDEKDVDLYTIVDDEKEVIEIVKKAESREE